MNHAQHIQRELLSMESIKAANVDVQVDIIDLSVVDPFNAVIPAVADKGADIDAISGKRSLKCSKHVKYDRRSFRVRTGSGYV